MNIYIVIVVFLVIAAFFCHVIHELMHVFAGKMQGLNITKIQWFTYHGGTKVFFENEDKVLNNEIPITKQWIITNIAGMVTTTLSAYLFTLIYYIIPLNYWKLFAWILSIVFLLSDSTYAVICAFFNCGDLYLVNEYLGNKRFITRIIAVIVFVVNCLLTYILIKY